MLFSLLLGTSVISFLGIIVMISYRLWEIKSGKILVPDEPQKKNFSQLLSHRVLKLEKEILRKIPLVLNEIKKYNTSDITRFLKKYFPEKYFIAIRKKVKIKVLGRNGNNGTMKKKQASKFLKTISDHKETIRRRDQ